MSLFLRKLPFHLNIINRGTTFHHRFKYTSQCQVTQVDRVGAMRQVVFVISCINISEKISVYIFTQAHNIKRYLSIFPPCKIVRCWLKQYLPVSLWRNWRFIPELTLQAEHINVGFTVVIAEYSMILEEDFICGCGFLFLPLLWWWEHDEAQYHRSVACQKWYLRVVVLTSTRSKESVMEYVFNETIRKFTVELPWSHCILFPTRCLISNIHASTMMTARRLVLTRKDHDLASNHFFRLRSFWQQMLCRWSRYRSKFLHAEGMGVRK